MQRAKWPYHTLQEIRSVNKVILSNKVNYWTGKEGKKFENEFADYIKTKYAIAVSNGTVALELALHALNIKKGDEILVTPRSYIASASCVVSKGAIPVFVDVDLNSQNISPNFIEEKITKKTKAIICVHLAGWPCEMDEINKIAKKRNLFVIEDCSQAHGAKYKGKFVGSLGDIGTFSFCNDKIMNTLGEGGIVTTNSKKFWKRIWEYKDHGRDWKKSHAKDNNNNKFKWIINSFGSNFRLTEVQSAVGRIQLKRLNKSIYKRNLNARKLESTLSKFNFVRKINKPKYIKHSYYRYYAFIEQKKLNKNWNRDKIIFELNKLNINAFHGSCPEIYLEKPFNKNKYKPNKRLINAKILGQTSIAFLVHPNISEKEILYTCKMITKVFTKALKK